MKQARLNKENDGILDKLRADAKNDLLTEPIAINLCFKKGEPIVRKLFVKPGKSRKR